MSKSKRPSHSSGKAKTKRHLSNDKLFRHTFAVPLIAQQFLRAILPESLIELADWSTMKIPALSGINATLTERKEDIVYTVNIKDREICFYLLLEHQSLADSRMALRLLEYRNRIWQYHLELCDHSKKQDALKPLPLVIPIVIYTGRRKWKAARRLRDLIYIPESIQDWAEGFIPDSGYLLVELADMSFEKLADGPIAKAILRALQKERQGPLDVETIKEIFQILFTQPIPAEVETVMHQVYYYLLTNSNLQRKDMNDMIDHVLPVTERIPFMTTADMLRKEGIEQGKITILRQLLERRFGELPEWVGHRLDGSCGSEVEQWTDRILTAKTLIEIFEGK